MLLIWDEPNVRGSFSLYLEIKGMFHRVTVLSGYIPSAYLLKRTFGDLVINVCFPAKTMGFGLGRELGENAQVTTPGGLGLGRGPWGLGLKPGLGRASKATWQALND
ncbi:hypothetical protein Hanom_Chr06g00556971 [Helianthus anomalus]